MEYLIAIIALYIAYQQWQTSRQKLKLDLYKSRLRIYEEVKKILSIMIAGSEVSSANLINFYTLVSEADFLFGPEIRQYIDEIYSHGVNLRRWNLEYRDITQDQPEGYDHNEVVRELAQERQWLGQQFEPAREKFKKYLSMSK